MNIALFRHRLILAVILIVGLPQSSLAELYKIVDEDGNVTFSQFPPNEPEQESEVENIRLDSANDGMTPVTRTGSIAYCGDIELPQPVDHGVKADRYIRDMANNRKTWQRRLDRLEKQSQDALHNQQRMDRYRYSSYYRDESYRNRQKIEQFQRQEAMIKDMRDLRCALNWADGRDKEVAAYRSANHEEMQRLKQVHRNLIANMATACGDEPALDPSDQGARARRAQWLECSKNYQQDIRTVSRELQKLSRALSEAGR